MDQNLKNRLDLHDKMCEILGYPDQVYFKPPESLKIKYPAIIYYMSDIRQRYADNKTYKKNKLYNITVIETDPDSDIVDRLLDNLEGCKFDRNYKADNLIHTNLTVYL